MFIRTVVRQLVLLFVFTVIATFLHAELPDSQQYVSADFIPENVSYGGEIYPIDPSMLCNLIVVGQGGFSSSSVHPDTVIPTLNSNYLNLVCNGKLIDSEGNILEETGKRYTLVLTGSYGGCPSSYSNGHTIKGELPYYSDKHCYKPLKCEAPFTAVGLYDSTGKLVAAQCRAYCPSGVNFDYGLGRCDIQKDEQRQCDALVHNPIDTSTGEKVQSFSDYTQSSMLPLSFERNYGSLRAIEANAKLVPNADSAYKNTYVQPSWYKAPSSVDYEFSQVGKQGHIQWRHNYQLLLEKYSDENIVITLGDRTRRKFIYDNDTYNSLYPNGESLTVIADGWRYTSNKYVHYDFNSVGQLVYISNDRGQRLTLSYNTEGYLRTVTNGQNETLTYDYDEDGLLVNVTQPDGNNIVLAYDDKNNLAIVTYPDETPLDYSDNLFVTYHYEDTEHPYALTGITDEKGIRYATWAYNDIGQAISSSHALNTDFGTISYDTAAKKVISTNALGHSKELTFDALGRVTAVIGESCSTSGDKGRNRIYYDGNGKRYVEVDEESAVTRRTFATSGPANGLPTKITEASGQAYQKVTDIAYSDSSTPKPTSITHPNGLVESFIYGINGRIEAHSLTSDGETRTTTYGYNAEGLLSFIDGPREGISDTLTLEYLNGRVATSTNALGHTTTFENYNSFGNATKITSNNGVVTILSYDVRGRLINIDVAGRNTQFDYDALGQIIRVTEPSGRYIAYTYDDARRVTSLTNNLGESIHFTLDAAGNVIQQSIIGADNTTHFVLQYTYDQLSRLSQTISATNQVWTNEYDVGGNLAKKITPVTTEIDITFDKLKRVTKQLDEANSATQYQYNNLNQITKVIDPLGRATDYTYNGFGDVISLTSSDSGTTSFSYDEAGNLLTKTDARGVITTFSYDELNRLSNVSYSDSSDSTTFIYDSTEAGRYGVGRLTQIDDELGSTKYFYNAFGEVTKQEKTYSSQSVTYITEYGYNLDGQVSSIIYPSGRMVNYTYNTIGLISQVNTTLAGDNQILASDISYLPFGGMLGLTYGNNKTLSYSFNQNYQLTDKVISGVLDKSFAYDAVNNINAITDENDNTQSETFNYDSVNRLLSATSGYYDLEFTYDAIGNRLSKTENGNTENYVYDTNQLIGNNLETLSYDTTGNLLAKGADTFVYNDANRLIQANLASGSYQYMYNHKGQRVMKVSDDQVRIYHYDESGLLLAETDQAGTTLTEYYYLNGQRLAMRLSVTAQTESITADLNGDNSVDNDDYLMFISAYGSSQVDDGYIPAADMDSNGIIDMTDFQVWYQTYLNQSEFSEEELPNSTQLYYVHTNHLDAPLALSDQTGNTVWQASYTPFGKIIIILNNLPGTLTARFPGQYADAESGFYYNYFRDYDPELGRYIQSDPIGLAGGINTYAYVENNPIKFIDPYGLEAWVNAFPNNQGGFNFVAHDDQGSPVITGSFNNDTVNTNQIRPGTYNVTPRPVLPFSLANWLFNRNENAGFPTISNTDDWNTILYANGDITRGAQFHEGLNGTTFGASQACMVSDRETNNSLNEMFRRNYNNGGVTLTVFPAGFRGL